MRKIGIFKKSLLLFLLIMAITLWVGKVLDHEAGRTVNQLMPRHHNGLISGLSPVSIVRNKPDALILIHGFLSSPQIFSSFINRIKDKVNADIYAPVLPFHARSLEIAAKLDNQFTLSYLENYINQLAKKYQSVTVVGFSYGGALVADLAANNRLANNVNIILYAPAIFITTNDLVGRLEARIYGVWRNYCNYETLGCEFPTYESGDATARKEIELEKTFPYKVISAVLEMYELDLINRNSLIRIRRPYSLILAKNDNRVSYASLKQCCDENKNCRLYTFASGGHMLHWSRHRTAFEALIIHLLARENQAES